MPNLKNILTPYSSVCALLSRQHIIPTYVFKSGASSLTQRQAGYRVRKVTSSFISVDRVIVNVEFGRLYEL